MHHPPAVRRLDLWQIDRSLTGAAAGIIQMLAENDMETWSCLATRGYQQFILSASMFWKESEAGWADSSSRQRAGPATA